MTRSNNSCNQKRIEGWIFDIYQRHGKMVLWIKTGNGCTRISDEWQNHIYVGGDPDDLTTLPYKLGLREDITYDEKRLRLKDRKASPALKIPVSNHHHALALAEKITRLGDYDQFQLYNVDVPPDQMYLYQKELFPLAHIEAHRKGQSIEWRIKDSVERRDYTIPAFTSIELDVKTESSRIPQLTDPILRIELHTRDETIVIDAGNEESKLLELCETIRELDPDIIFTKGGDAFLFPYLIARAFKNQMQEEFILDRENLPLKPVSNDGRSYFSYGRVYYKPKPIRILGRLHIDLDTSFLYPSCGLEGIVEASRVCRMPLHRAVNSTIGTIMTSLQMYYAIRDGVLIPWEKNEVEDFKTAKELLLADRGGFIYEPRTGVHDDVGEIDFSSLYPMLMMKHNLSPECISCECCPDSPHRVPELGTHICQKRQGFIPQALKLLIEKRLDYKRMQRETRDETLKTYDRRHSALKWILVCCFGYLGYRNARFGKIDAHIATCAFARDALVRAARLSEERGFEVIHGIVDSLWLKKAKMESEEFIELCKIIHEKLGLPISFKGKYRWIVFSSSKIHAGNPVLNRYFGVFENGEIKARGIELQRRDTSRLIKDLQKEMLRFLAKAPNSKKLRELAPETANIIATYINRITSGDFDVDELAIKKYLSKNPCAYNHNVLQAIVAKQLLKEGARISAGQPVRYIITDADHHSPNSRATAIELAKTPPRYDTAKYIELLISAANSLLHPLGYTMEKSRMKVMRQESYKSKSLESFY